jgi:choline dehydrogenase-like flavoprotein
MLVDANDLSDGTVINADLCVVGAGAAGVTIAHALRDSPLTVALLESGGTRAEAPTQALYEGTYKGNVPSIDAGYLSGSRIRVYGGSTNLWGGYCRPLDALDFELRDWVPDSGWPIKKSDLDPYYHAASAELGFPPFDAAPSYFDDPSYAPLFSGGALSERLYRFHFVNIGANHLEEFKASTKTTLYLHANAVDLRATPAGTSLDSVTLLTLSGRRASVRARAYVLSAGGIENPRLLLASRGVNPNGVGNDNDLVGRYFMEHLRMAILGPMFVWKRQSLGRYDVRTPAGDGAVTATAPVDATAMLLAPSDTLLRERKLLNVTVQFGFASSGPSTLNDFDLALVRASADMDGDTTAGGFVHPHEVLLALLAEQAPNRDSRVTLGQASDALGVPRAELDWRIGDLELDSMLALVELLGETVGGRKLGRTRVAATRDDLLKNVGVGYHHMGTTRMSADPKRGVVDSDCKVHGLDNLFVAGSSVFPTSGAANPTFTILALALRLSEHLRGRLS